MKELDLTPATGKTTHGTAIQIKPSDFSGGLNKYKFELGEDINISKPQSSATLRFVTDTDIYYAFKTKNRLLVKAGGNVPYYNVIHTWSDEQYEDGIAEVHLDLRPVGVYGRDYDPSKINDGKENFEDECVINVTPTFEYFKSLD
jgi:hypothetical protein